MMNRSVPQRSERVKTLAVVLLIVAIGAFYITTIRPGHDWGGDFSLYIHHAKNIVEGRDYADTGYLFNPRLPQIGPRACPPLFPLLLSPVYAWRGLDLAAMKVEIILFFMLFLWVLYAGFRSDLPFPIRLGMVAVVGLNPHLWDFKDKILTDLPFLPFLYLCLFAIRRAGTEAAPVKRRIADSFLAGLLAYLCCTLRPGALTVLPALWLLGLVRFRRASKVAGIVTACVAGLIALQVTILPQFGDLSLLQTESVVRAYPVTARSLFDKSIIYLECMAEFWTAGSWSRLPDYLLFVVLAELAVVGYVCRVRRSLSIFETFVPVYGLAVLAYPGFDRSRYLIPMLPLFVFYACAGLLNVLERMRSPITVRRAVPGLLALVIFAFYLNRYRHMDFGPIPLGVEREESKRLFQFVRTATGEDDVLVFFKPRVIALYTGRRASACHPAGDDEIWDYLKKIGATHVITGPYQGVLGGFSERQAERLHAVFRSDDFAVYRIRKP
jgi:hypothetical protein